MCGYAHTVEPSATGTGGGPQRGEGLADPVVLGLLQVAGQDPLLVLQLLQIDPQHNASLRMQSAGTHCANNEHYSLFFQILSWEKIHCTAQRELMCIFPLLQKRHYHVGSSTQFGVTRPSEASFGLQRVLSGGTSS